MRLDIDLSAQRLSLLDHDGQLLAAYPISSALNGPGETHGSGCTPRGRHRVRACIGREAPAGAVFVGRRWTGEIFSTELAEQHPERDWILSRILWLGGLEPGINRYAQVDTQSRFIYIHGTADEALLGQPVSHGCIRMANDDVMALFDRVEAGCAVDIHE
ncbi:MAG: L,D-transpeptidase [Oceanococcus sp.]|nr:MAG: L,D-transpeptidase [Oceanococcus sp.]